MPFHHQRSAGRRHLDLRGSDDRRLGLDAPLDRFLGPGRQVAQFVAHLAEAPYIGRHFEMNDGPLHDWAKIADRRRQLFRPPGQQNCVLLSGIAHLHHREPGIFDLQVVDQSTKTADHQGIGGGLRHS